MEFEFDPAKSAANKSKHGIDFVEAQALWQDDGLADAPVVSDGEPRFLVIGRIDGKHWTAVCTLRGGVVRIISVRRARKTEVMFYDGA
ncbi:MAG: BrnT family toxin [Tabrizicola sp.]|uniref:BrnT family toxin n=1 Tax=Tabrizicola sp. TaxID=2005166 RepID=UPI0027373C42|nr:BrnT family toxin [Tabrizicola sp.]MDP3263969.1 BrnT family toxin [Tabrizicola sp.]MDP3649605.1 BrnT family toxin [Paracoccaceae bacterium]MDZ4066106.1 BrnT family toxin [Tabrizicola sp.]